MKNGSQASCLAPVSFEHCRLFRLAADIEIRSRGFGPILNAVAGIDGKFDLFHSGGAAVYGNIVRIGRRDRPRGLKVALYVIALYDVRTLFDGNLETQRDVVRGVGDRKYIACLGGELLGSDRLASAFGRFRSLNYVIRSFDIQRHHRPLAAGDIVLYRTRLVAPRSRLGREIRLVIDIV